MSRETKLPTPFKKWLVERRLKTTATLLRQARADLVIVEEQLEMVSDDEEYLRIKAMSSEHYGDVAEHREGKRSLDGLSGTRNDLIERIKRLAKQQDDLLDRLSDS